MKTLSSLLAIAALTCACSKSEPPAPAPAPAPAVVAPTTTAAPAAVTTTTTTTASGDLPSECNAYLDKVMACANKQPGAGAAMKQAMDQTKASWAAMSANKAALASACKTASDSFAQQAAMMKC